MINSLININSRGHPRIFTLGARPAGARFRLLLPPLSGALAFGNLQNDDVCALNQVRLESGDVLVFGGPARLLWHGLSRVLPNQRPKGLVMAPGRLNLTFREL